MNTFRIVFDSSTQQSGVCLHAGKVQKTELETGGFCEAAGKWDSKNRKRSLWYMPPASPCYYGSLILTSSLCVMVSFIAPSLCCGFHLLLWFLLLKDILFFVFLLSVCFYLWLFPSLSLSFTHSLFLSHTKMHAHKTQLVQNSLPNEIQQYSDLAHTHIDTHLHTFTQTHTHTVWDMPLEFWGLWYRLSLPIRHLYLCNVFHTPRSLFPL